MVVSFLPAEVDGYAKLLVNFAVAQTQIEGVFWRTKARSVGSVIVHPVVHVIVISAELEVLRQLVHPAERRTPGGDFFCGIEVGTKHGQRLNILALVSDGVFADDILLENKLVENVEVRSEIEQQFLVYQRLVANLVGGQHFLPRRGADHPCRIARFLFQA